VENLSFYVNGQACIISLPQGNNTLDFLRKNLGLFGTKEGCREGECGACTVIVARISSSMDIHFRAMASCLMPLGQLQGCHVITIEGLDLGYANPLQQAFIDRGASQCGFCTPGFILSLTAYFLSGQILSLQGALNSVDGNICRCTGYNSIHRAIKDTLESCGLLGRKADIKYLVEQKLLPSYFLKMKELLLHTFNKTSSIPSTKGIILAGGTDLYIQRGDELPQEDLNLIIPESEEISLSHDGLILPASLTMEQLRLNPQLNKQYPGLEEALLVVASPILRNRATLGGNMVNASPIADTAVLLLSWDAKIRLSPKNSSAKDFRQIPLKDFFLDYKKLDLKPHEWVHSFFIPPPTQFWNFKKISKRERLDIASCNSAISFNRKNGLITQLSITFGGVAPIPLLAKKTMAYMEGKSLSWQLILLACEILKEEIAPIDDSRGSGEYKGLLAQAILKNHFLDLFPDELDSKFLSVPGDETKDNLVQGG
jgi:xanthine dehydrogenase small subunit